MGNAAKIEVEPNADCIKCLQEAENDAVCRRYSKRIINRIYLNAMSDEEKKCHADLIEDIISRKMRALYWIIGGSMASMLTIYVTIALPISSKVIDMNREIETKISTEDVKKDFITKSTYIFLQSQCHEADIEAIRNPQNSDLIYNKEIHEAAKYLEFVSRGGKDF